MVRGRKPDNRAPTDWVFLRFGCEAEAAAFPSSSAAEDLFRFIPPSAAPGCGPWLTMSSANTPPFTALSSAKVPCSTMRPPPMTMIRSASGTTESECVTSRIALSRSTEHMHSLNSLLLTWLSSADSGSSKT